MLARGKKAARLIALLLALPVGAVAAFALYVVISVATYEQVDDAAHMVSKQAYLETLAAAPKPKNAPDVVLILFDDLGHGDVGFMGNQMIATPHMDALAKNGVVLENYYAPAPVCSPSRAAMLTGRLPSRNLLTAVPFPNGHFVDRINRLFGNPVRLPREEIILSEVLKAGGYHTAMVGKWHMGDHDKSIPTEFGFERFFGTYHSNDMNPFHLVQGTPAKGETIAVAAPVDQTQLNGLYAEKSEKFITAAPKNKPMFLYLAHNFPHVPLHVAAHEHGRSDAGLYGDVIEEIDHNAGRVLDHLKKLGIEENTIVIFTSDNGPWLIKGDHGGSALPLFEGKMTSFEGGQRVPAIIKWPGHIPAGSTCSEMALSMDLHPTLAQIAGAELKPAMPLDGKNILHLLTAKEGATTPHEYFFFVHNAVRSGDWKYHKKELFKVKATKRDTKGPTLYNLKDDIGESRNVIADHPEIAERLSKALQTHIQKTPRP